MLDSAGATDEKKSWIYAFTILLVISIAMLTMRLAGKAFLVLDFELALVYIPTILAGIAATYLSRKSAQ
jgi:hypothetical protein